MNKQIKAAAISFLLFATGAVAQTTVTGTGTTNTIPLFTGSSTLGNSNITQSNGNIGIGTTTPIGNLSVATPNGTTTSSIALGANGAPSYGQYSLTRADQANGIGVTNFFDGYAKSTVNWQHGTSTGDTVTMMFLTGSGTNPATLSLNGSMSIISTGSGAPLTLHGPSLGSTAGNTQPLLAIQNLDGTDNVNYLNVLGIRYANGSDWTTATTRIQQTTDVTPQGYMDFNPVNGKFGLAFGSGTTEFMRIASGGNIGIGTTTPGTPLEVNGSIKLTQGSGSSIVFQDGSTLSSANGLVTSSSGSITSLGTVTSGVWHATPLTSAYLPSDVDYIDQAQTISGQKSFMSNVGIGTTNPGAALDVESGSVNIGSGVLNIPGGGGGTNPPIHFTSLAPAGFNPGGNLGFWLASTGLINANAGLSIGGNTGIGTTSPGQLLQVGATYSQNPAIMIGGTDSNNSSTGSYALLFGAYRDVESIASGIVATPSWVCCGGYPAAGYAGIRQNSLGFYTIYDPAKPTAYSPNMLISTNGNVGIGTATPGASLEVNGNLKLTQGSGASITYPDGTVQSTAWNGTLPGGDYAESIDVQGDRTTYEPGDVIVIDPTAPGKFIKSEKAYSKLVAGVFSTKPGLVGRRTTAARLDKDAEVPMAMMGIVPTKVSSENGTIEPGDLLVSASTPGYAMKGTDSARLIGAVIGKALAPLKSDAGVIEVLISLQ